jgi:hypothetical protein
MNMMQKNSFNTTDEYGKQREKNASTHKLEELLFSNQQLSV